MEKVGSAERGERGTVVLLEGLHCECLRLSMHVDYPIAAVNQEAAASENDLHYFRKGS